MTTIVNWIWRNIPGENNMSKNLFQMKIMDNLVWTYKLQMTWIDNWLRRNIPDGNWRTEGASCGKGPDWPGLSFLSSSLSSSDQQLLHNHILWIHLKLLQMSSIRACAHYFQQHCHHLRHLRIKGILKLSPFLFMWSAKKPYFLYGILKSQGGIHDDDDCVDSQNEVVVVMEMKRGWRHVSKPSQMLTRPCDARMSRRDPAFLCWFSHQTYFSRQTDVSNTRCLGVHVV